MPARHSPAAFQKQMGAAKAHLLLSSAPLTQRELQVLALVGTGKTSEEVARRMAVCDDTVKFHLKNIFRKLGARCRTEAVFVAHRAGLVTVLREP